MSRGETTTQAIIEVMGTENVFVKLFFDEMARKLRGDEKDFFLGDMLSEYHFQMSMHHLRLMPNWEERVTKEELSELYGTLRADESRRLLTKLGHPDESRLSDGDVLLVIERMAMEADV